MWIKGSYRSNHPKDKAARRAKELQGNIRSRQCTKSEMFNPTEHNVKKHIREQQSTLKDALELKKVVKKLNKEDHSWGNTETFRRR